MKKLITFVLLVAGVVSAQAGSVKWGIGNLYTPTADVLSPGSKSTGATKMAVDANYVIELLWSADNSEWTSISTDSKLTAAGTKSAVDLWNRDQAEANRNAEGNVYFKVIITYTDANGGVYVNTAESGAKNLKNIANSSVFHTFNLNGSTWSYTAPATPADPGSGGAPEPTSGLLMLVGGAMLALRRKQK